MAFSGLRFAPPVPLSSLIERHGGTADRAVVSYLVEEIAPLEAQARAALSPFTARRHLSEALASPSVLLVDASLADLLPAQRRWVHPHAAWALAGILDQLSEQEGHLERTLDQRAHAQIDPTAVVAPSARIAQSAIIFGDVHIGEGTVVEPHAVIYPRVRIGARSVVGAGAVIGRPGFGWATGPGGASRRIPQLGGVLIEDDVDVGPLCTVDAGTLGPTVLRSFVRLDAHVHVGHNARIGAGSIVAAQSGFAGSVQIGARVLVGGQAGFADHVKVGEGARIAARSGVIGDIPENQVAAGYPAIERTRWLRGVARMLRLDHKTKAVQPGGAGEVESAEAPASPGQGKERRS